MATNKNITIKQFNGTDYDTLYPKTIASQIPDVYSKTNTITAETLSQLGLSADKLPNDAFQQIKTLIDNVQSSTDSKARIQTGSYVGTGTYGANNPCSLTFDFTPSLVIIYNKNTGGLLGNEGNNYNYYTSLEMTIYIPGLEKLYCEFYNKQYVYRYFNLQNNTLQYYSTVLRGQMNDKNNTYLYVAIG